MAQENMNEVKTPGPAASSAAGLAAPGSGVTPAQTTKRVIFDSGAQKVVIKEAPDSVVLQLWEFPLWPYSNYVCDEIRCWKEGDRWVVFAETIRDSWYGTGADAWWAKPIPIDEHIIEALRAVKTPDDFKHVAELLKEKKRELEEQVEEAVGELLDELSEYADMRRFADWLTSEEAREKVKEYLEEYFFDDG